MRPRQVPGSPSSRAATGEPTLAALLTRARWIEIGRIVLAGTLALLYWHELVPLPVLLAAVAIGLSPLAKTGLIDFVRSKRSAPRSS